MVRFAFVVLTLALIATSTALAYYWTLMREDYPGVTSMHPILATPRTISTAYKTAESPMWKATLALSADGRLREVRVDCDGRPYVTAPVGNDFPPNTVGAYLGIYNGANCSQGLLDLTVIALSESGWIGVPGIFIPSELNFKNGHFVAYNVGKMEDLPLSARKKYCQEKLSVPN
jgi:hypothetical protein